MKIFRSLTHQVMILSVAVFSAAIAGQALAQPYGGPPRGPGWGPGPNPNQGSHGPRVEWETLGCVRVGRRPDLDVIEVGRQDGRFRAVQLRAFDNDVEVLDFRVIYGNGQPDFFRVRRILNEGAASPPLDLAGRDRFIRQLEIVTSKAFRGRHGRGPARLCAYGLQVNHAGGPFGKPNWGQKWGPGGQGGPGGYGRPPR